MLNKKIQVFFGIVFIVLGLVCISCEDPENGNADPGTADAGCPTEPLDTNVTMDTAVYNAEALCNNDTVCDDGETVMSCPGDCWDITRTTTCRAAYNETRMSCLDYTVDTSVTTKTEIEIYQNIYDSCVQLGRGENCQLGSEEECIVKVSQGYSCLQQACDDTIHHNICIIPPVNVEGQIQSLDYGVTTVAVFPNDLWTQMACNTMSGLNPFGDEQNDIIKDDDITCDLY